MKKKLLGLSSHIRKRPAGLFIVIFFIAVNLLSQLLNVRWDFTEANRHSLSPATEKKIAALAYPITIRYYISRSENVMPYQLRAYAEKVEYFLDSLRRSSKGKLTLITIDTRMGSEQEKTATFDGIDRRLSGENSRFYFGVSIHSKGKRSTIPFLHPDREALLEYDLYRAIASVSTTTRKKIGIISSLPIEGGRYSNDRGQGEFPAWIFLHELRKSHDVVLYDKDSVDFLNNHLDLLILIHPGADSEEFEQRIDQYLADTQHKLIVMLDPYSAAMDMINPSLQSGVGSSGLPRLLNTWGVNYRPDEVVADMLLSSQINRGFGEETSHTILAIERRYINARDEISMGINNLGFAYSGHFWPGPTHPNLELIPLVSTSEQVNTIDSKSLIELNKEKNDTLLRDFQADGKRRALVAKLVGKLPRAFEGTREQHSTTPPYLVSDTRVVLFGDVDFIFDPFAGEAFSLSKNVVSVKPYNGNLALFSNTVDALLGDSDLASLRSKGSFKYALTKLASRKAEINASYAEARRSLQDEQSRIDSLLASLAEQRRKNQVSDFIKQKTAYQRLVSEGEQVEQQLGDIDRRVDQRFQSYKNAHQWTIILLVPSLVFLAGVFLTIHRTRKTRAQ